jgi:hypothetical protein
VVSLGKFCFLLATCTIRVAYFVPLKAKLSANGSQFVVREVYRRQQMKGKTIARYSVRHPHRCTWILPCGYVLDVSLVIYIILFRI